VNKGLRILVDLHQRRWESKGDDGCFATSEFRGFISDAAHELFAAGQLQLIWIELEGTPIAVDFNLVTDDGVYGYQGGVSPETWNCSQDER
jgi:CelD/BcsL family acetyltransferase involved in cellulose biosynthesis